jgi:rubredoxin
MAPAKSKSGMTKSVARKTAAKKAKPVAKAKMAMTKKKPTVKKTAKKASPIKTTGRKMQRYKCIYCGYIYSPLIGEPHNGIPAGTAFEDLPDDYKCPICGMQGKGKIGKWGFEEWRPTKYICSICGYIYDEARGEPHRGIRAGTKFDDLPDDYTCPVCFLDTKIRTRFGKVGKEGFGPLNV